jgi:hypothetical protein
MPDIKTLIELETEAFGILTGNDPSQSPATEDIETIGEYVGPLLAQLSVDVVSIPDSDEIPVEYFLPLARLLANVAAPRYGQAFNEDARIRDEAILRKLTAARPTYETLRADYF